MISETINKAVLVVGGQANLARKIGASSSMVYQWKKEIRPVSAESCMAIDRATNGEVACEDIRPDLADLFGYIRGTEKKAA